MIEIIVAVVAGIVTIIVTALKQHYNHREYSKKQDALTNLITDKDKKQDIERAELKNGLDAVIQYIDKIEYREDLINKIKKTCNTIIAANSLDNGELLSLLNNTKSKYILVIESILKTKVSELKVEDIKIDIKTFGKHIRTVTNFDNIDVPDDFCDKLKTEGILPVMEIFVMRVNDEIINDTNKYNGTFEKIAIGVVTILITNIIKIYRDCKNK